MSTLSENIISNQNKFGSKIKLIRERNGFSQLDLASLCNLDKTSISRIENGRTNVTIKTATLLSHYLEVELKELFEF